MRELEPTKFLRLDRLQPLDVILSVARQHPKQNWWIKWWSRGNYSHAALVVSSGWWFESDENGCFTAKVPPVHAGLSLGDTIVLADLSKYRQIAVYRHPDLREVTDTQAEHFRRRIDVATESFRFHEYPAYDRLLGAVHPSFRNYARALRSLVKWATRWTYEPIVPGKFCSETIAHVFQELGIPLFDGPREPSEVNPSDLARSRLELVNDVVIDYPADMASSREILEAYRQIEYSRIAGRKIVEQKRFVAVATSEFSKVNRTLDAVVDQITKNNSAAASAAVSRRAPECPSSSRVRKP
jgi:hypothetical protein